VILCKDDRACWVCAKVATQEVVDDAIDVIQRILSHFGKGISFACFDGTIPPRYQRRVMEQPDGMTILRRIAAEAVQEVIGDPEGLMLGHVHSAHFWHSSAPEDGAFPHTHGTILPIGIDSLGRPASLKSLYVTQEQLDQLRAVWQRRVRRVFGDDGTEGDWNVWYHVAYGEGHLRHWLEYQFRRPIEDVYKRVAAGLFPTDVNPGWLARLVCRPKGEKRCQWYGWLSDNQRTRYLDKIDLFIPKRAERNRKRKEIHCPECHQLYVPSGQVSSCVYVSVTGGYVLKRRRRPGEAVA
jgi:hypothetical protein